MSDAFDGAGREYRGPTFRAVLLLGAAILVTVALTWVVASWALNQLGAPDPPRGGQGQEQIEGP